MSNDPRVNQILTAMVASRRFRMFGRDATLNEVAANPIADAMVDEDAMFALGVDARAVIAFVLDAAEQADVAMAARAFLQRMDDELMPWPEPEGGGLARASGYEYVEKPDGT